MATFKILGVQRPSRQGVEYKCTRSTTHRNVMIWSSLARKCKQFIGLFVLENGYGLTNRIEYNVGVMGFHSLLQSKMIPFESAIAKGLNMKIFKKIKESADKHNHYTAMSNDPEGTGADVICPMSYRYQNSLQGKFEDTVKVFRRNVHVTAIAPTMSISSLCNMTSSGIEPMITNAFTKKVKQGSFAITNKYLTNVIEKAAFDNSGDWGQPTKELWVQEQWASIKKNNGSVQHLDWMDQNTKDVFKTAFEIDQRWVIEMAGDRQQFIDQAQSLNLFIPGGSSVQHISDLHILAWKKKVKSLYYLRSTAINRASTSSNERKIIETKEVDMMEDTCIGCT